MRLSLRLRMLVRVRDRLSAFLEIDGIVTAAVQREAAERQALEATVRAMAETNRGLAQALQAAVAQLNRNTVMMQRWATESATLSEIERRHARKEQSAIVRASGHDIAALSLHKGGA